MPRRENASDRHRRRAEKQEKKQRAAAKEKAKQQNAEAAAKSAEKSVEDILKELELEEAEKKGKAEEKLVDQPSARVYSSLTPHPTKDQLLLFGGEFADGQKTRVYNDLFSYTPSKKQWKQLKLPNAPRPRSAHVAVATQGSDASLFVFGGEFTSPTGSQFYHYNELWRLPLTVPLAEMEWELIDAKGGPGPRSGHRMIIHQKRIIVFGGFMDNNRSSPKYFNDTFIFDLMSYKWTKIAFPAVMLCPDPRSAVQISASADGVLVGGGYAMSRAKGEVFSGKQFQDSWLLSESSAAGEPSKWSWSRLKDSGVQPNYKSGAVMVSRENGRAYSFGGADDEEDEETITSTFHNVLYSVNVGAKPSWHLIEIGEGSEAPVPRINAQMAISGGKLYVYGGSVEVGSRQLTLSDLYCLDVSKKKAKWECYHTNDSKTDEWLESESESSDSDSSSEDEQSKKTVVKKKKGGNKKGPNPLKARLLASPKQF